MSEMPPQLLVVAGRRLVWMFGRPFVEDAFP
jgi:hypothetical protein